MGGDVSGCYHRGRPSLSVASRVLDDATTHRLHTPCHRKGDGPQRGHASAGEKVFGSFLESSITHVRHRSPPPPQLRNEGDWARPGHTLMAFDYLYPGRDFPAAGHWHLQPPEFSSVPPALHLHIFSGQTHGTPWDRRRPILVSL